MNTKANKPLGLVFSGGGAKGSYQIGVWKALREGGLESHITHVAGTSVGALNACFFALGELEQAQEAWKRLAMRDVLELDVDRIDRLTTHVEELGFTQAIATSLLTFLGRSRSGGVFSRARLSSLIDTFLDCSLLKKSQVTAYATCYDKSSMRAKYFLLNREKPETIKAILLASSAIPLLFASHAIGKKHYLDGGVVDNTPIRPLYDVGVRQMVVVHLTPGKAIKSEAYPGSHFLELSSVRDRGSFVTGTLNFTQRSVQQGIDDGYSDTMRTLQRSPWIFF